MSKHLHIDPFSGIAGDMLIGALLDAGLKLDELQQALAGLPIKPGYTLTADHTMRCGIGGTDFKVHVQHDHSHEHNDGHGHHHHHHHTHRGDILKMVDLLPVSDRAKERARKVVDALAHAEAAVHRTTIDKVHFHEVGAVDSIVDMLGAAVALDILDITTVSCGPLPITRGYVKCDHGKMPVPAPATAELMRGLPTIGIDRAGELVTPTGAALVTALADHLGSTPPMTIHHIGYGAGDRDDPEMPNLLRVFIGKLHPNAKMHRHAVPQAKHQPGPEKHEHTHSHGHGPGHTHDHSHEHKHDHAHPHKH
jgi:uncharacterized protein (TIGR00299 family) protein